MEIEECPNCKSKDFLVVKTLLIHKRSPEEIAQLDREGDLKFFYAVSAKPRDGNTPPYQLAVDMCKPDYIRKSPLEQFIDGLFCTKCEVGFVPDAALKNPK